MTRAAWLLALAVLGGLGLGWLTTVHTGGEGAPAPPAAIEVRHAGAEIGVARQRLAELGVGLEAAVEEELELAPPIDVAVLFRRDLTAIEQRGDGAVAWIVDFSQDYGRRGLRVGDVYQDGWRVTRIETQHIELRRRREVRRVAAFSTPEAAP